MATKYISDIKTIEESGNTGIRIEISENAGDLTVRAVNTTEFNELKTQTDNFKNYGITISNLKEKADAAGINAATLKGYLPTDFLTTGSIMLVGRVTMDADWDYSKVEGAEYSFIHFSRDTTDTQGFLLIVRPGGFLESDAGTKIPISLIGYNANEEVYQHRYITDHILYLQEITWTRMDGTTKTENCMVCPVTLAWEPENVDHGEITFNYKGKSITRLWQFEEQPESEE
jgi:hypothetical protein